MGKRISGIQQVGIGIPDVHKAWKWYRNAFGIDIRMFEEAAEAALMGKLEEAIFKMDTGIGDCVKGVRSKVRFLSQDWFTVDF